MDSFSVPLVLYILTALSIAALISLGVMLIITGEVTYVIYNKLFGVQTAKATKPPQLG